MSISYGDKSLTKLRSMIAAVEREFSTIPPSEPLRAAWSELIDVLSLGPSPALRTCPTCGEIGMRAATRCVRCWSALTPLPADEMHTAG